MITTEGKLHIKRYLGQIVPNIAESMAFGLGDLAESVSNEALQFETARSGITYVSYDFVNNKLIFKAPVPSDFGGKIYEVGLFSKPADEQADNYGSRLITTFDSATEDWVDSTTGVTETSYDSTTNRIGVDGLRHNPATSGTKSSSLQNLQLDLLGNSSSDQFKFSFYSNNAFASQVQLQFRTDAGNYYSYSMGAQTAGYKIVSFNKGSATIVGSPTWGDITEIRVVTTSTSGGSALVVMDGIRIEDLDTINPDYVLVARKVLTTPFTIQEGMAQDIEFSLDVSV